MQSPSRRPASAPAAPENAPAPADEVAAKDPVSTPGLALVVGIAIGALFMFGALATDALPSTPDCAVAFEPRACGVDPDTLASPFFLAGAAMFTTGLVCAVVYAGRRRRAAEA